MTHAAGNQGAHIGGSLSLVEIMAALYCSVMNLDPDAPLKEDRDRLILSKGHGAMALYSALSFRGYLGREELQNYKSNDTLISAHPTRVPERGLEFASGSLGQGLSLGVGVCLALLRKGNLSSRVFVLQGDGEIDEGAVWEAAASASHFGLSRLVTIIDKNGLQYDGPTEDVLSMGDLAAKWRAFGWEAREVDGHDVAALYEALMEAHQQPLAVIAKTVKGKGVSFFENDFRSHNARLSLQQYEQAMAEQEAG
jgi:transketolase